MRETRRADGTLAAPTAADCAYHRARNVGLNKTARRRALAYGVVFELVDVVAVLERDAWTCQICLGPIDPALRWQPVDQGQRQPNGLMPSLDHLVPLCRGGSHTFGNLRAAHLTCNAWRGEAPPGGGGPRWSPGPLKCPDWSRVISVCGAVGHADGPWCLCEFCLRHPLLPASRAALYGTP